MYLSARAVSAPQTQDSSPPETRSRRLSEQQRRWSRHALRSLIHHHPARSEHKFTIFTNQSLKQLLTFYASVIDCSTGWTNLPSRSLKFGNLKETLRPTCTANVAQECTVVSTNTKMWMSNYLWRKTCMDVCVSKLDSVLTLRVSPCAGKNAPHFGRRRRSRST